MDGELIKALIKKTVPYAVLGLGFLTKYGPEIKNKSMTFEEACGGACEDMENRMQSCLRRAADEEVMCLAKQGNAYAMDEADRRGLMY